MTLRDQNGFQVILAETVDPIEYFIHELCEVAKELEETTRSDDGCDSLLPETEFVFSAAIAINLACNRMKERENKLRQNNASQS
jgi:hypothetical protein